MSGTKTIWANVESRRVLSRDLDHSQPARGGAKLPVAQSYVAGVGCSRGCYRKRGANILQITHNALPSENWLSMMGLGRCITQADEGIQEETGWIGGEGRRERKRRTSRRQVVWRWKGVPESLNSHVLTPGNHEALHLTAPPSNLRWKAKSPVQRFPGTDVRVPKCWAASSLSEFN